jgi:hypothetical protein
MPFTWAACKVLLSGMQIPENYAFLPMLLVHATNNSCR